MSTFKIPYTEMELNLALITLNNKKIPQADLDKAAAVVNSQAIMMTPDGVAEYHKISTTDLANSPNRKDLYYEVLSFNTSLTVAEYEKIGFSKVEAWAIISVGLGAI